MKIPTEKEIAAFLDEVEVSDATRKRIEQAVLDGNIGVLFAAAGSYLLEDEKRIAELLGTEEAEEFKALKKKWEELSCTGDERKTKTYLPDRKDGTLDRCGRG